MTKTMSLTNITQSLDAVATEYASLLKQAEAAQCPIAALPKAKEELAEIKKKLDSLLVDASCLPDTGERLETESTVVLLLNAVKSALYSMQYYH